MKKTFILAAAMLLAAGIVFAQTEDEAVQEQPAEAEVAETQEGETSEDETSEAESGDEESEEKSSLAQDPNDQEPKIIELEDKYEEMHPKAHSVTLKLEWTPISGEATFTYTCLQASFDVGEAMNVAIAVYEEFARDNNFKHYKYVRKDKKKYFKDGDMKMATYTSRVVFKK